MVSPRKSRRKSACFSRTMTSTPCPGEQQAEHHAGGAAAGDAAADLNVTLSIHDRASRRPVGRMPDPTTLPHVERDPGLVRHAALVPGRVEDHVDLDAWTPGTDATAFSTQPGISPATGQPGAVRVMSMATLRSSSMSTR